MVNDILIEKLVCFFKFEKFNEKFIFWTFVEDRELFIVKRNFGGCLGCVYFGEVIRFLLGVSFMVFVGYICLWL